MTDWRRINRLRLRCFRFQKCKNFLHLAVSDVFWPHGVGNYCDAILSGDIIAGRYVQLAVERHLDDLEHAHERGLHFDADIVEKSCGWWKQSARIRKRSGRVRDQVQMRLRRGCA